MHLNPSFTTLNLVAVSKEQVDETRAADGDDTNVAQIEWRRLSVGDIVKITADESVPGDRYFVTITRLC